MRACDYCEREVADESTPCCSEVHNHEVAPMKVEILMEVERLEDRHTHEVTVSADVTWDGEHHFANLSTWCIHCHEVAREFAPQDLSSLNRQVAEDLLAEEFDKAIEEMEAKPPARLVSIRGLAE